MTRTDRYDAFISYRHCAPDSEIASRLQKKLEGFRLPKDIAKKAGRNRLSRIFRDETEFAVADDLTQAIDEALVNSDFLIAICSPEYLKSQWCRKEIESFLRFHDRKHVLLVLAEGEPMESFPPEIIYDDLYKIGADGRPYWTKVPREPLAADCRGENAKERNPKIDKATMRLIAAILGIGFDDLQQRHRHEQYKHTRNRVFAVFGVLVAFLAICVGFLFRISKQNLEIMTQNEEIARQNEIISLKYADTLAATSDNLLRDGKRKDAVYAARLALPDEKTDNYSELASKALANALGIYDFPNTFGCDNDILLPCSVLDELVLSSKGGYASVKDLDHVRYVVDMNSGSTVLSFEENDYSEFAFDGEQGFVFKRQDDNYSYFEFASGTEMNLGISKVQVNANNNGEGYVLETDDALTLFNGSQIIWHINYSDEDFPESSMLDTTVGFVSGTDECWIFITDYVSKTTNAYIVDMMSGSSLRMLVANAVCYDLTTDGKSIVWKQEEKYDYSLWIKNTVDGSTESTIISDAYDLIVIDNDVVVVSERAVAIYDKKLNEKNRFETGDFIRTFVSDDAVILLDSTGRLYRIMNGESACYDTLLADGNYSWMKVFRDGKLYAAITGDNHIYTYTFRHSDYMTVTTGDYEEILSVYADVELIYENPVTSAFVDLIIKNETEFQQNRIRRVVMCQNADLGLVQLYDGAVHIYDSSTGAKIKTIYSVESRVSNFYYDSYRGYYYLSSWNVDIYDEDFKNIYSIKNCVLAGIEKPGGNPVLFNLTQNNPDNYSGHYTACPVTYEQLISMADDYLSGYEPDERVKEKYSLG
ncbi:MAG: TIR domain-containing protein [Saccharofermentans sp.]|nr:TIR domain-containing protein [Saccharofermentans sp.]